MNPWGDSCFTCGKKPNGEEYGLLGPLKCTKEQHFICKDCVDFIKRVRKQTVVN